MTDENHDSQHNELSADDAQAIDALIEAGFDISRVPENLKPHALKAAGLLSLLHGTCKTESAARGCNHGPCAARRSPRPR